MSADRRSDYEIARARKIKRNNARLRSLGLISAREERASNNAAAAAGAGATGVVRSGVIDNDAAADENNMEDGNGDDSRKKKRTKKPHMVQLVRLSTRKSKRVQGLAPDGPTAPAPANTSTRNAADCDPKRDNQLTKPSILRSREENYWPRTARTTNPTATYSHCLHRVRTLTDPQLRNRIQMIERCAGKHCVIKMAIMVQCLRDEGRADLAHVATASLARLEALLLPGTAAALPLGNARVVEDGTT